MLIAPLLVSEVLRPNFQPCWTNKQNRQWQYPVCWYFKLRGHDNTIAAVCSGLLHCFCSPRSSNSWLTLASRKHSTDRSMSFLIQTWGNFDLTISKLYTVLRKSKCFASLPTFKTMNFRDALLITWSKRGSLINTMHMHRSLKWVFTTAQSSFNLDP